VADYLNRQFPMDLRTTQYFTFFYGLLDTHSGEFRYVNAGHPQPILAGKETPPCPIPGIGFPVGMLPEATYQEERLKLKRGQRLYLYTDGVVEASGPDDQEFGTRKLMDLVQEGVLLPLDVSVQRVVDAVGRWCAPAHPRDDLTLLAMEWSPQRL
jgi:sigma-B regulation protein RsbU (phosphoserine phosphatase)